MQTTIEENSKERLLTDNLSEIEGNPLKDASKLDSRASDIFLTEYNQELLAKETSQKTNT